MIVYIYIYRSLLLTVKYRLCSNNTKKINFLFFTKGIPDNPDLAETFYEQFNEFDDDNDIVVGGSTNLSNSEDEDVEGTLVEGQKDEEDFINYLQRALEKDDGGKYTWAFSFWYLTALYDN